MGSYLGRQGLPWPSAPARATARTPDPTPAPARNSDLSQRSALQRPAQPLRQVHRVQLIHRAHPVPRHRPAQRPPDWDPSQPAARRLGEAWVRFPQRKAAGCIRSLPADWWECYLKRSLWALRHPKRVWSPVTVQIAPPERLRQPRVSPAAPPAEVVTLAGANALEKTPSPNPCAKETVLSVLRDSGLGKVQRGSHLFTDPLDPRAPPKRPSAFRVLERRGHFPSYAPRPGPLQRGLRASQRSDQALRRAASSCSLASDHLLGAPSAHRNAISSSYSSLGQFKQPRKRSASPQTPEWPVKRPGKSPGVPVSAPLKMDKTRKDTSRSGPSDPKVPMLSGSPGDPTPQSAKVPLGDALSTRNQTGNRQSGPAQKGRSGVTTANSSPQKPPDALAHSLASAHTALAPALELLLESLKKSRQTPAPSGVPQFSAGAIGAAQTPPKRPSLPSQQSESSSDAKPKAAASVLVTPDSSTSQTESSSDSKPKAAAVFVTPDSSTSPVSDASKSPPKPKAEGFPRPQHLPRDSPAPPARQSDFPGGLSNPVPPPPASLPPAATSDSSVSKPSLGLPSTSSGVPRGAPTASTTPTVLPYTFKPIFGTKESPQATPLASSLHLQNGSSPHHLQGTVVASSLAGTPQTGATQVPQDVGATSFSLPTAGFVFSAPRNSTIPTVQTVTILNQVVPSTVPISSNKSTSGQEQLGGLQPVSNPVTPAPPAVSARISTATTSLPTTLQTSARPPFPPSVGAVGSAQSQKPSVPSGATPNSAHTLTSAGPIFRGTLSAVPSFPLSTSIQPAWGSKMASSLPLPQAGTSALGVVSQAPQRGPSGSVFGSTAPRPFAFGGLETPMDCVESGLSGTNSSDKMGASNMGPIQSGTVGLVPPFGSNWSQNIPGQGSQSSVSAFGGSKFSLGKIAFGAFTSFAQTTLAPGPAKVGSGQGSGVPPSAAPSALGRGPVKSFSIGIKSKTSRHRDQGHSRRRNSHKK
ncbi:POM121-like protein 2 [Suncus etruscus]|uniref:POM121-like protein 2 n=1 Tax=Suncus etruscus TaxID=109475 RepID=UPI00210FD0C5|nr:POM121-like protein 2 [Suncus etruscus]